MHELEEEKVLVGAKRAKLSYKEHENLDESLRVESSKKYEFFVIGK